LNFKIRSFPPKINIYLGRSFASQATLHAAKEQTETIWKDELFWLLCSSLLSSKTTSLFPVPLLFHINLHCFLEVHSNVIVDVMSMILCT